MPQAAAVQQQIAVQSLPDLGADVYASEQPLTTQPSGRAVFGGLLIAQAISAAFVTVALDFHVYSSHSTFLRPVTVTAKSKVIYRVDRPADGRSYATRHVRAFQGNDEACVFMATISFQKKAPIRAALDYHSSMPDLEGLKPEDVSPELHRLTLAAASSPNSPLQPLSSEVEAFDRRPIASILEDNPSDSYVQGFVRSQEHLTDRSVAVNQAAFAFMSDEILLGVAIWANPDKAGGRAQNVGMAATLSHNIYFHDPTAQVDEWMVLQRATSWGGSGRALINEQTWNMSTGRLIMTCTQEALIRLKDENSKL